MFCEFFFYNKQLFFFFYYYSNFRGPSQNTITRRKAKNNGHSRYFRYGIEKKTTGKIHFYFEKKKVKKVKKEKKEKKSEKQKKNIPNCDEMTFSSVLSKSLCLTEFIKNTVWYEFQMHLTWNWTTKSGYRPVGPFM